MITAKEMEENRDLYIEGIAENMADKGYKVLEDSIDNGEKEFQKTGSIRITTRYASIQNEILEKEGISDPTTCIKASRLATGKIKKKLEESGWEIESGHLRPIKEKKHESK